MLKAIEIENFKAFGERVKIDFAPITLIFGENSAGKSTILQSLNLLKQTIEARDYGAALLPRVEGGIVDLGGFNELLFDHDTSRELTFQLTFDLDKMGEKSSRKTPVGIRRRGSRHLQSQKWLNDISLEVSFVRSVAGGDVKVSRMKLVSSSIAEPIASLVPTAMKASIRSRERRRAEIYGGLERAESLQAMTFEHVTHDTRIWEQLYRECYRKRDRISNALNEWIDQHLLDNDEPVLKTDAINLQNFRAEIDEAIEFYRSDFKLDSFASRVAKSLVGKTVTIDGFMPSSADIDDALPEMRAASIIGERAFSVSRLLRRPSFGDLLIETAHLFQEELSRLFPLGPYRRAPERWYIYSGTSPRDVGHSGQFLPDLLRHRDDLELETNQWLERLGVGYQLRVRPIGLDHSDLFEVRLQDTRRENKLEVGLCDVGFGVSQILPFIVQSLAGERQILSIEQPEVHIHPKLQAELGDLLAEAILQPRSNRFIVETHSEHLVLRLQRLVREGKLKPDQVSILYVSRGNHGAKVNRLHLDEEGEFLDNWPGGFFPERLRELM